MKRRKNPYNLNGRRGCVSLRRSNATRTVVGIYHAEQAGIDVDPSLKWATVCEAHSTLVLHATLENARMSNDPREWCEDCRKT